MQEPGRCRRQQQAASRDEVAALAQPGAAVIALQYPLVVAMTWQGLHA